MKNLLLICGTFFTFLNTTFGAVDGCPKVCDPSKCEESTVYCDSSIFVKDDCDCCDVCLRSRGKICGGLHSRFGKCEAGLECANDDSEAFMSDEGNDNEEEDVIGVCQAAQDCILSKWSDWSKCSEQCGFGTMKRRRVILQAPKNGGRACPSRHEKKGCFQQNCKGNMVLAQILPAEYRRKPFGSNVYDKILPEKKELTEIQKIRKSFRSHCVNFKLMSKHPYCKGTWAEKLNLSKPMCVECQPSIMDDKGFCKGEGIVGNFTSWVATDAKSCSGLWMRVGEKIPNCKCVNQEFQNFIFV